MKQIDYVEKNHERQPETGNGGQDIPGKVEAPAKVYMSDQEFTAHMAALIPTPSAETNDSLLDLANSLWFGLKEDLYHTFSFIARHFTPETLQTVYDLCKGKDHGILPWELVGTAIYLQAGTPSQEIGMKEWKDFQILSTPEAPDTLSTMGICTVREHGKETRFYTLHFGQFDPQELLDTAAAQAGHAGITVTEAIQRFNYYDMQMAYVEANKAVYGPESPMAEKLSLLMAASPITAAHITIDVDSGSIAVKMNPLWEKLRDGREVSPPARRQKHISKHKKQPER